VSGVGPEIVTASVEEGLDFAASLIAGPIEAKADANPNAAPALVKSLSRYVEWRYHSEYQLALEMLADLGSMCIKELRAPDQFWQQISWLAKRMELSAEEVDGLGIPTKWQQ
jgi:hypothetical protein